MTCDLCKSIADHPSNVNETLAHCGDDKCSCKHFTTAIPAEKFFDGLMVDLEWVRTRRTMDYSKQEMEQ